jgi:hydroxymethylglutaryl-CoA lyase
MRRFRNAGIKRFYIAGSMGMEDPRQVGSMFRRIADELPDCEVGYHVHNLSGCGTANVIAALDGGARFIEGSICGLGGGIAMPTSVARWAPANEDPSSCPSPWAHRRRSAGSVAASREIAALLGIEPRSHAAQVGTRRADRAGPAHPRNPHPAVKVIAF